ncbi:MAG TPA: alpha/beta hydrolase [Chloroflexota bacterium]|nr:alpha/beta hydrolase [Chloroflexota bacterium]
MTSLGKTVASAIGASALGSLVFAAVHGSQQICRPCRTLPESTPGDLGFTWEPAAFKSFDGTPLSAWLIPNNSTSAAIIVLHGFGGNKGHALNIMKMLANDYNVFAVDVRGHGESGGAWTSVGHFERYDAIAASEQLHQLGFGPIGTLGVSMGGAIAILAAAESPLIRAVVADSAFATLRTAVLGGARLRGYPSGFAEIAAITACRAAAARLGHVPSASDPIGAIARISPRPILLVHCACDAMIPLSEAQALYAASGDPCDLWVIPELAHAESSGLADLYQERVVSFFRESLR